MSGTNSVQMEKQSENLMAGLKQKNSGSLGLMPYNQISQIPSDAEWQPFIDDESGMSFENTETHKLTWIQEDYDSIPVYKEWKFFINTNTNLPHRIECYEKLQAESEYELRTTIIVEYPDDDKMQAVIDSFRI